MFYKVWGIQGFSGSSKVIYDEGGHSWTSHGVRRAMVIALTYTWERYRNTIRRLGEYGYKFTMLAWKRWLSTIDSSLFGEQCRRLLAKPKKLLRILLGILTTNYTCRILKASSFYMILEETPHQVLHWNNRPWHQPRHQRLENAQP